MLDGFLLRLARRSDADAFVLRGGRLVRHWFPQAGRPARDIDLVCRLPYDEALIRQLLSTLLSDRPGDGVQFDFERFRLDSIHVNDPHPAMRLFCAGKVDGWSGEMTVDLTFHLEVWPAAETAVVSVGASQVQLHVCQPAMLIGRKLRVTEELGTRHWRPKDLWDLQRMLRHFSPRPALIGAAIERTLGADGPQRLTDTLSRHSWGAPQAGRRWQRFLHSVPSLDADRQLAAVVGEVRSRLREVIS